MKDKNVVMGIGRYAGYLAEHEAIRELRPAMYDDVWIMGRGRLRSTEQWE